MELYKVGKVNFENYPESFENEFMEFLKNNKNNILYYRKRNNKIIIYGIKSDEMDKYPTEEELTTMVDNYIEKYLNPDDLPENEVTKEEFKELVNNIENPKNFRRKQPCWTWTLTYCFDINDLIEDLIKFSNWVKREEPDSDKKLLTGGITPYPFTVDNIIKKYYKKAEQLDFLSSECQSVGYYDNDNIVIIAGTFDPDNYKNIGFIDKIILPKITEILESYSDLVCFKGAYTSMISLFSKLGDKYGIVYPDKMDKENRVTKIEQNKDKNPNNEEQTNE